MIKNIIIFLFCVQNAYGQQVSDTIKIKNFLGDFNFKINNQRINRFKLIEYTERNIEANQQFKKSNTIYTLNFIPSIAGGALIGWFVGQLISRNNNPDYILLGIGSGLLVTTIPLTILSNNHARKGVRMYNESVLRRSQIKSKLDLQISPTRAQIVYSF